ncbi:MAG TPA: hypothetical protein PLO78_09620 [Candidatus Omnitrophota bacterium]|nr:hypothetical protein [Candidatus Omnitrophota bacterium]
MEMKFNLLVMSLKGVAFDDEVESVYLTSDDGEFELLPFHHPLVASIPEGELKIAGNDPIPITIGILTFKDNRCCVVAEIDPNFQGYKLRWDV